MLEVILTLAQLDFLQVEYYWAFSQDQFLQMQGTKKVVPFGPNGGLFEPHSKPPAKTPYLVHFSG